MNRTRKIGVLRCSRHRSNIVVSAPHALHVCERLKALGDAYCRRLFLSETAQLADIVLPTAQWAEEEGTMTNLEGRVIARRQAFEPLPGVRSDVNLICDLADRLGKGQFFVIYGVDQIFDSCVGPVLAVSPITRVFYEKIKANNGVFWPCPAEDNPGTPRLFQERFHTPTGKAGFHADPSPATSRSGG